MLLITNLQACQPRRADGRDGTKSGEQEKKRGAGYRAEIKGFPARLSLLPLARSSRSDSGMRFEVRVWEKNK